MIRNKWIWYGLVLVALNFLLFSFAYKSPWLAIAAFALALLLKKDYHRIPLPKYVRTNKVYSAQQNKVIREAEKEEE